MVTVICRETRQHETVIVPMGPNGGSGVCRSDPPFSVRNLKLSHAITRSPAQEARSVGLHRVFRPQAADCCALADALRRILKLAKAVGSKG